MKDIQTKIKELNEEIEFEFLSKLRDILDEEEKGHLVDVMTSSDEGYGLTLSSLLNGFPFLDENTQEDYIEDYANDVAENLISEENQI